MSETSIITLNNLGYHNRLDSDFYKPSFLLVYKQLNKLKEKYPFVQLTELIACPVRTGATQKEREPLNDGTDVLFIKTDSVRKGFVDYNLADLLPLKAHKKQKLTSLKYGDIIVTVVGATHDIIARAGLYLKKELANINQSNALVRVNPEKIEPGYLSTFINSKYGRIQLWRYSGQTGQVTMNCREVEQLKVLILPKGIREEINKKVLESENKRIESDELYNKANDILLKELDMPRKLEYEICYKDDFSKIKETKRLDAEYHHPKYKIYLNKINEKKTDYLENITEPFKRGVEVGEEAYQEKGIPFIRVSNLTKFGLVIENAEFISLEDYNFLKKNFKPKQGEILLSKDATPGIAFLLESEDDQIISSGILRLSPKENINPYYLTLVLNSIVTKFQYERDSGGSIILHLKPSYIKKIIIPLLENIQNKIGNLMKKSYTLRVESIKLLKEAKEKLETEIEKSLS